MSKFLRSHRRRSLYKLKISLPCSLWKFLSVVWIRAAFPDLLVLRYPGKIPNVVFNFLRLNFIPKFTGCGQSWWEGL